MTISEAFDSFINSKKLSIGVSTVYTYQRLHRLFIAPQLGQLPADPSSSPAVIDALFAIREAGHSRTAQQVEILLREFVPAIMASVPHVLHRQREISYWSSEQAAQFLRACPTRWALTFELALYAGLRRGEICGLKWQDIDWDRRIMHISRQRSLVGSRVVEHDCKSASSCRSVPICDALYTDLVLQHALTGDLSPYVAINAQGYPLYPSSINAALRASIPPELPRVTVHGLRHTFASAAINAGEDSRVLQSVLGHASIDTTARVYAHVSDEARARLCGSVSKCFEHLTLNQGVQGSSP